MAYRLALKGVRGGRIKDILAMDHWEFAGWCEYWHLEPFGEEWSQTASIQATMANCHSSKKKYKVSDFMPATGKTDKQAEAKAGWVRCKAMLMASDKRRREQKQRRQS